MELLECKFCKKPRYKPQGRGWNRVQYQRMWYLPIMDRLKRIYQSQKTATAMIWHAEHTPKEDEINNPSDAKAWKHLNSVHPDFASNIRNVWKTIQRKEQHFVKWLKTQVYITI